MKTLRPRQSAEQWSAIVTQFNESGLSTKAFCKQHDLALATFSKWRRKIRTQAENTQPAFKQVKTAPPGLPSASPISDSSTVTLSLGNNIMLTIQSGSRTHEL